MKIAFIGLGVMGAPMAGHLQAKGHSVTVFNRSSAKAQAWAKHYGGSTANSPIEAVKDAEIVCLCVGNDDDVRRVVLGDESAQQGIMAGLSAGAIVVDHTTTSAKIAIELAAILAEHKMFFIDAPVSGGQAGAEKGILTVMCGGDESAFLKAQPVLMSYAQAVTRIGPSGKGQLAKMVNQICIAGLLQGLAEGVQFGLNAGLNMPLVLDAISQGAASSWQMINRGKTMVDHKFDFGFAVDWMRKDLGLCLDEARRNHSSLPAIALVDQFYGELQAMGGARWDTSSLIKRLPKKS